MKEKKDHLYNYDNRELLNNGNNYFCTDDFDLSAVLLCNNYTLEMIDSRKDGKNVFVFKNDKDIEKYANAFFHNRITVNMPELTTVRENLKSHIHKVREKTKN